MNPALSFDDGLAVVAGGSGGIGAAIARAFGAAGVPVLLSFLHNADGAAAVRADIESGGGSCEVFRCDLTRPDEAEALLATARSAHRRVAQVVYAAGASFDFGFIGEIPDDDWARVVDTDVKGAFHLTQSAVRAFRAQDGGNLVAVTTAAVGRVASGDILSAAPKAAVETLVRGVAKEAGRFGVRANCVQPGWIDAGLGKRALDELLDERRREKVRTEVIPLRRFGDPDEVAWATLFLCSRQAGFITGQSLAVDGGAQI